MEAERDSRYEMLVVGSGEAGKYLAWNLAKAGHRVAMVERKMVGGSCPNIACLPSKNIIHSAKIATYARKANEYGLDGPGLHSSMPLVLQRKQRMVAGLIDMHLARYRGSGVDLIMGEARFTGERKVEVTLQSGGTRTIEAEHLFLNLGTTAAIPDVPGLAAAQPVTHVGALDLDRVPEHLIILGGGYIGLEFAQAMRRFGARVTILERGSRLLRQEDEDVSEAMLAVLRDEGVEVLHGVEVQKVEGRSGERVEVQVSANGEVRSISGTDLLVAAGRVPNTRSVGLEALGVALDSRGYVQVNDRLQTTAPNVWAMGDCAGSPQFTHAAYDDFRVVFENLQRGGSAAQAGARSTQGRLIPYCMFTNPELVRVGWNESEARRRGVAYRLARMNVENVPRTRTVSEMRGYMKVLIAADSDRILGFTAFCVEASETLAAVQTAMLGGLPYTLLRDAIFAHPTISEGLVFLLGNVPTR